MANEAKEGKTEMDEKTFAGGKAALKIAPPWYEHVSKIRALFACDPEVKVEGNLDGEKKEVIVRVDDAVKAAAIAKLLPEEKDFGGVKLAIKVVPANGDESVKATFRAAFAGNPVFKEVVERGDGIHSPKLTYAVFAADFAQFWNDNLGQPEGRSTFLYETLAKDVLETGALCATATYIG